MKVAPPSADLLIKLAIGVAVVGAAWWAVRRAGQAFDELTPDLPDLGAWVNGAGSAITNAASVVGDTFTEANDWAEGVFDRAEARRDAIVGTVATAVNPTNPDNLAYRGVNAVGSRLTGDASFSLGSWVYDLINPQPITTQQFIGIGSGAQDARRIDRQLGY